MNPQLKEALTSDETAIAILQQYGQGQIKFVKIGDRLLTASKEIGSAFPNTNTGNFSTIVGRYSNLLEKLGLAIISDRGVARDLAIALGRDEDIFDGVLTMHGKLFAFSPRAVLLLLMTRRSPTADAMREQFGIDWAGKPGMDAACALLGDEQVEKPTAIEVEEVTVPAAIEPKRPQYQGGAVWCDASVRDDRGFSVLAAYSPDRKEAEILKIPVLLNTQDAEAAAILLGYERFKPKLIYTDCKNIADLWKEKKVYSTQGRCASLMKLPPALEIRWIPREENAIADWLSRQGSREFYSGKWLVDANNSNGRLSLICPEREAKSTEMEQAIQKAKTRIAGLNAEIRQLRDSLAHKEANLDESKKRLTILESAQQALREVDNPY